MTHAPTVTPHDLAVWRDHVGRQEVRRQRLDSESLRRFAAAQGASLEVESAPPPLAHWTWFVDVVAPGGIGPDGHPRRGGLMPPVTLPRLMFASADILFDSPLELDAPAEMTITIAAVDHKSGKTGDLVFVEVDRVLTQAGAVRLTEHQTIVYRGVGALTPAVIPTDLPPHRNAEVWDPGPVDLFRFSAVTFNSHRIHYDAPYAIHEEGYPGLVVHGPFTAARLFALAQRRDGRAVKRFGFRAAAPLFAGQPIYLVPGESAGEVQALRCDGVVAMTAVAGF